MKLYPLNFIEIPNGETLAYRTAGKTGPQVILLHGNMSSSVHFTSTMDVLKENFRVYAVDLRGFGKSTYNKPTTSLRELGQDIQLFMDALSIHSATLMGWSTGGGVALEIAADIPDRINQIFLLGSVGLQGYISIPSYHLPQFAMLPSMFLNKTRRQFMKWDPVLQKVESAIKNRDRKFMSELLDTLYFKHNHPDNVYNTYLEAMYDQRNYSDIFYNLIEFNMTDSPNGIVAGSGRYSLVKAPIVIIHGKYDVVVDPTSAEKMKAYYGDQAKLYMLESGHSVMSDDFDTYISILQNEMLFAIN